MAHTVTQIVFLGTKRILFSVVCARKIMLLQEKKKFVANLIEL